MNDSRYVLALDQGTTSSRAMVFDRSGAVISVAHTEFPQLYPRPGWVEHDPFQLWSSQSASIASAMAQARVDAGSLAAIGLTNQRETTLVWDRETGVPVYNAIVWQDRRTAELCDNLKRDGIEPMVTARTGLRLDPYFSATKVSWILEHVAGARARAEAGDLLFGTVDSWLVWQLTAGPERKHVTDASNASRTLLFDIRRGRWDEDLLALFRIPRAMMPEVCASSGVIGEVGPHSEIAKTPIAGIAGDQQAALFGQACFTPGLTKNTYGTGCFLLMNTGSLAVRSRNNLLTTVAWRIGNHTEYALEGSVFIGGALVQWLRDELKLVGSAKELDELAASVPDASGLFLVPAFAGLGAPHWDPYARGLMIGITRGTSRAHFCRAAIESVAYQVADLIGCMEKDSGLRVPELRVDGGMSQSAPLLQFQADLLGGPVVRPRSVETSALGAAYLAGLAVGYWEDQADIARHWRADVTVRPSRPADEISVQRQQWSRAIARAAGWEKPS